MDVRRCRVAPNRMLITIAALPTLITTAWPSWLQGLWPAVALRGACSNPAAPRLWGVPYVRMVRTASGATAVQILYSSRRGSRDIEHIGSTHVEAAVELIKTAARQRIDSGHGELDLGLDDSPAAGGPLEISFSRAGRL